MADDEIRIATDQDLAWLTNGFDRDEIDALDQLEIEEAKVATPTPSGWRPIEVDEAALR